MPDTTSLERLNERRRVAREEAEASYQVELAQIEAAESADGKPASDFE